MAKTLSIITNGNKGGLPVQNAGLKLSKIIAIDKIEKHEEFENLYAIDEDVLGRIVGNMNERKEKGLAPFNPNHPIEVWKKTDDDGTEHLYLIDGHTRLKAAQTVGLTTVPYCEIDEKELGDFEEAKIYAFHEQIDRRNLTDADLLHNVEFLMGTEYIKSFEGNRNAAIGRILGKSEKTIERAKKALKESSEEQIAEIEAGNATIYSTNKENDEQKKADRQLSVQDDSDESEEDGISDFDSFDDDISDALEDTSGDPKGIVIGDHSDHIERPTNKLSAEEDSERTQERRKAYELGFMDGFLQAANYVLMRVLNGQANSAIYIDIFCNEHYHNYEHFKLCDGDDGVYAYEYNQFRKALLADRPNLKDLNEIALKDYDRNNTKETDESTDESFNTETDEAFDIDFEDGNE
ncbi:MAG: hypothetical protein IJ207_08865 [Treponema sp.]|uniref:hypothetical protein n=1 Tax=Treponema sp. TaxID=166 RepID=UPI0025CCDDCD|nr:hypothetical protein [Treponema sp.]MBQ9282293.1 hypothetical protein [Treponema sp.]